MHRAAAQVRKTVTQSQRYRREQNEHRFRGERIVVGKIAKPPFTEIENQKLFTVMNSIGQIEII